MRILIIILSLIAIQAKSQTYVNPPTCPHIVWDQTAGHGDAMMVGVVGILGHSDSSCLYLTANVNENQLRDSVAKYNTKVVSRSAGHSTYSTRLVEDLWYEYDCLFVTGHYSNNDLKYIEEWPHRGYPNDFNLGIRVTAGDSVTQNTRTSIGNAAEFCDSKNGGIPTTQSHAAATCGTRLFQLRSALPNESLWNIRNRAQKTADNYDGSVHNIYNGFGQIDVSSAINYTGTIDPDPYRLYDYRINLWDSIPSGFNAGTTGKVFVGNDSIVNGVFYQKGRLFVK